MRACAATASRLYTPSGKRLKAKQRWAAIVALLTTVVGGLIVEWTKAFPIFSWTGQRLVVVWGWLRADYSVERWYLYALFLLACLFLIRLVAENIRSAPPASWLEYRSDTFLGIEWHWDYFANQVEPTSIYGICPRCQLRLSFVNPSEYRAIREIAVRCLDCGYTKDFEGDIDILRDRLERLIERNIRGPKRGAIAS